MNEKPVIERRKFTPLHDDQINEIAERAASKAIEKLTDQVYKGVGKSVVSKLFYVVGIAALGVYFWFETHSPFK